jgi:hypothetical protein
MAAAIPGFHPYSELWLRTSRHVILYRLWSREEEKRNVQSVRRRRPGRKLTSQQARCWKFSLGWVRQNSIWVTWLAGKVKAARDRKPLGERLRCALLFSYLPSVLFMLS